MKKYIKFLLPIVTSVYFLIAISAIAVARPNSSLLAFIDCGSQFILDYVEIENCTSSPCRISYGSSYRIKIHLTSTHPSTSFSQTVYIRLFGMVNEPINVTPRQPCSAIPCPLANRSNQNFQAIINVPGSSISIPTASELTWLIRDDDDRAVICMKTPIYLS